LVAGEKRRVSWTVILSYGGVVFFLRDFFFFLSVESWFFIKRLLSVVVGCEPQKYMGDVRVHGLVAYPAFFLHYAHVGEGNLMD
jgi:hypothetical protein